MQLKIKRNGIRFKTNRNEIYNKTKLQRNKQKKNKTNKIKNERKKKWKI